MMSLKSFKLIMIKLVKISKEYKKQLFEMMDEWTKANERIIPFSISRIDYHYFDIYINKIEELEINKTNVNSHVYFCLNTKTNKFIGAVTIRESLSDELLKRGGHISDGIRPSERRKGYGTQLVKLALEKCKDLNLNKVLMVCDKNNIASAKTITKNNGKLENEIQIDNNIIQRYWINL